MSGKNTYQGANSDETIVSPMNPLPIQGGSLVTLQPLAVTQAPKASYQTMKTFTGTLTTSATLSTSQTLYTVTAGKTLYITDLVACNNTVNAATISINASASLGASPVIIGHALNTSPFNAINIGTEPSVSAGTPVTFQSLSTGTITTISFFISGYEQ